MKRLKFLGVSVLLLTACALPPSASYRPKTERELLLEELRSLAKKLPFLMRVTIPEQNALDEAIRLLEAGE